MAKRAKKNDDLRVEPGELVPTNGQIDEVTTEEAVTGLEPVETCEPPDDLSGPSIEERLAKLEALLSETQAENRKLKIIVGLSEENASRLASSRNKLKRLKERHLEAKEEAAAAKKAVDAANEEHLQLEAELLSGQKQLPFPPPETEPIAPKAETTDTLAIPSGSVTSDDDAWRSVPLGKLGIPDELSPSIVSKLADANLATMGDLADYVKPGPTGYAKRLTDIPGIGKAAAEKIEEASMAFWDSKALGAPDVDVNRELLEGVEEIESARMIAAMAAVEADDYSDDDEFDPGGEDMSDEEEASWRQDAGAV